MFVFGSSIRQALTILPAGLCEFSSGIGYGWMAPILQQLKNSNDEFSLTTEECSWIAALPECGRVVGGIVVFLAVDVTGRKRLYHVGAFFYVVSWLIILFWRSALMMAVARSIFGIMKGLTATTTPIYLAEISSPQTRGIFGSFSMGFYYLGILVGMAFASFLSYRMAALAIVNVQVAVLLLTLLVKEPPQFLVMKNRHSEAEDRFYWLQASTSEEAKLRYGEMVKSVRETNEKLTFREVLSKKANYKSITIVSVLGLVITLTGLGALNTFVTIAFSRSATVSARNLSMLLAVIQLTSMWTSSCIIERFNRRTYLLAGLLTSTVAHFATAVLYYWQQNVFEIPYFSWLIFTTITVYAIVSAACLFPMFFLAQGELFAQNIKGLGSCLAMISFATATFLTSYAFLQVADAYGIYYNFVFFSLMSVIAIIYVYGCLPETRGKSLPQIQELLEK